MRKAVIILLSGLAAGQLDGQLQPASVPSPASALGSGRLSTGETFDNYARLTGRTILRPSNLPASPSEINSRLPDDTNAAIALIESELARNHIEAVRDGDKFMRLLPVGAQRAQLANIKLRHSLSHEPIPSGSVSLVNVDLDHVLALYAELRNRTILRSAMLQSQSVVLRTENVLTVDEVVYALEVVLAMNGVATVDDGVRFVQVVQLSQASRVQSPAPKPELNATLIDPRNVPVFKQADPMRGFRVAPSAPSIAEQLTSAYAKVHTNLFGPPPAPPKPTVDNLIAYYARLIGRTAIPSKVGGQNPIFFETRTPLTKPELIYAIEATLALDGLKIVPAGNKSIRAERVSGLRKSE